MDHLSWIGGLLLQELKDLVGLRRTKSRIDIRLICVRKANVGDKVKLIALILHACHFQEVLNDL